MPAIKIRLAREDERPQALSILYSNLRPSETAEHVDLSLELHSRGSFSLSGLHVAIESGRLVGAILLMISPGRSMLVWPPRTLGFLPINQRVGICNDLIAAGVAFGREQGVRFAQLLLGKEDASLADTARHQGFVHLTKLLHMSRRTKPIPELMEVAPIEVEPYSESNHNRFCDVMMQSYVGSLDCPELNGVRTMAEIMASHRAQGQFDARNWLLARRNGSDIGCLLLARLEDVKACEIAYLATIANERKSGVGKALALHAVQKAADMNCDFVTLSVDARNTPAVGLYKAAGFEAWDERDAFLLFLDPVDGKLDRTIANPTTLPYH